MKSLAKFVLPVLLITFVIAMTGIGRTEEPVATGKIWDEKLYNSYNEYHYPSGDRMFYLPRFYEVKFDIHNGKFFKIKYLPYHDGEIPTMDELVSDYTILFYTPTGKLFAEKRIKGIDYNRLFSIPHNDRSPNYERLIVKVKNMTNRNKDFCFVVFDPVDPVKGTPIKGANYRVIFE